MEELKEIYAKIKKSSVFNNFGFLAHFFIILDKNYQKTDNWQVGFYNKEKNKIAAFIVQAEVKLVEESEPFKKKETEIEELNLDVVKKNLAEATEIARLFQFDNYKGQTPTKIFVLLQMFEHKPTWNITYITQSINTLNIKIDAVTGEVYSHELTSLMQWKKK